MHESEPVDALAILLAGLLEAEAEAEGPPPSAPRRKAQRRLESGVFRIELPQGDDSHPVT
jgi:hypothetical protein